MLFCRMRCIPPISCSRPSSDCSLGNLFLGISHPTPFSPVRRGGERSRTRPNRKNCRESASYNAETGMRLPAFNPGACSCRSPPSVTRWRGLFFSTVLLRLSPGLAPFSSRVDRGSEESSAIPLLLPQRKHVAPLRAESPENLGAFSSTYLSDPTHKIHCGSQKSIRRRTGSGSNCT